jgi:uncharacterized membrane protein (DUF2068 family)
MGTEKHLDVGFMAIAVLKIVKGVLLFLVGVGALSLIHKDVATVFKHWADVLQVNVHNRVIQHWLVEIGLVKRRDLTLIVTTTFTYSGLLLTEGIGLLLQKVWAEYMTTFITATFIPIEIYELARHVTAARVCLLVVNILIVAYLILRILQEKASRA